MQSPNMMFPNDVSRVLLWAFSAIFSICLYLFWKLYRRTPRQIPPHNVCASFLKREAATAPVEIQLPKLTEDDKYRRLFFKLHNIEEHSEVLTEGRDLLLSFFSEAISAAQPERRQDIFAIESFSKEQLFSHVRKAHELVGEEYNRYVEGRKAGEGRLIATDRSQAAKVLTALAPLKLVDGAWLGRVHQATTPFNLRPITKQAWQVLSEELGDGDLDLNHVHLYNELLREVGVHLPAPHETDFTDAAHRMDNENVWRAAVTQMLISLFSQEFLPEILGYSLHFEGLSMETMVMSRELQELKLNAQYFLLHVSIDNAHSGHAMMTAHTVAEYMSHITQSESQAAAATAWRRIQAGYSLSAHQCNSINVKKHLANMPGPMNALTPGRYDADMVRMLVAKAAVAQKTHSACRCRIGRKPLAYWLDPETLKSERETLQELSNASPWVIKGCPRRSRLMREVGRGGKMFGAFTLKETKLLHDWILSLEPSQHDAEAYWHFTNRYQESQQDKVLLHQIKVDSLHCPEYPPLYDYGNICDRALDLDLPHTDWTKILSLWFLHVSLLENWVTIPSRAATDIGAAVIRILRAQYSLSCEEDGVSGMDEIERSSPPDLIAIGLEVSRRKGLIPAPTSLSDVLARWPCSSAERLASMSRHPVQYAEVLLGMTGAFLHLQRAVLHSPEALCEQSRTVLGGIIDREVQSLRAACELIEGDAMKRWKLGRGYELAEEMIREATTN